MCDCIEGMNQALAKFNAELDIRLQIDMKTGQTRPSHPAIEICKMDSKNRQRLPVLFATYCPFCGEKYPAV